MVRPKELNKGKIMNNKKDKRDLSDMNWQDQSYHWEEVPDEDLWEDGELDSTGVAVKIYSKVCRIGDWKLIRETDFTDDKDDGRDREWEELND
jgi:hypothetical protein